MQSCIQIELMSAKILIINRNWCQIGPTTLYSLAGECEGVPKISLATTAEGREGGRGRSPVCRWGSADSTKTPPPYGFRILNRNNQIHISRSRIRTPETKQIEHQDSEKHKIVMTFVMKILIRSAHFMLIWKRYVTYLAQLGATC